MIYWILATITLYLLGAFVTRVLTKLTIYVYKEKEIGEFELIFNSII